MDWSLLILYPSMVVGHQVVQAMPIVHSCFGYNDLEARIFHVAVIVAFGLQCALVGVVVNAFGTTKGR
jgi:hypothetical protein